MISVEKYTELVVKLRQMHNYLMKQKRKIINEPESEAKYVRLERIELDLNRVSEIVNWWNNLEAKEKNRVKRAKEMARYEEKKRQKEKSIEVLQKMQQPQVPEKNKTCGYYCENHKGESYCDIGMEMIFCSKNCAYATNVSGSTRVYKK